jgi:thiamine monophosphate synthase
MPYDALGIETLKQWQKLSTCPLVAIGGINAQRVQSVLDTGVEGVAMISAITAQADWEKAVVDLLEVLNIGLV